MTATEPDRPAKGTPQYELWLCAIEVATAAPWKQGQHVSRAGIPWPDIDRLRAALEGVGIDWRQVKQRDEDARKT